MYEVSRGLFLVSDRLDKIDLGWVHRALSEESYWAKGRSFELVEKSIHQSLNLGLYLDTLQIGFARIITDRTIAAMLCDVFIREEYRKQGLGNFLVQCALEHPDLPTVNWSLKTTFSASLYERQGFTSAGPGWMILKKH